MIGDMIAKVRNESGMTKTELAKLTGINIGHLTHIEKGERNPSHKALKNICKALEVPYQQLMYTYDKHLNEEQVSYGFIEHITHNKVPAVNMKSFINCPANLPSASLAVEITDNSMSPTFNIGDYIFIEKNSLLNNKEVGIFYLNDSIVVRRFHNKNGKITLNSDSKDFQDIHISSNDIFYIIGKVLSK
jgi:SOS-response transcriptional repressor LexA